jgi:hypothetical protein
MSLLPIYLATAKGVWNYKVDVAMSLLVTNEDQKCLRKSEFRVVLGTGAAQLPSAEVPCPKLHLSIS